MKIKSVAIIGAGAIGCFVYWGLSDKKEIEISFMAEGERAERLRKNGVRINDKLYRPVIKTPEEARGADIIIVALKYTALESALDMIEKAVDDHTIVMSLMNGLDTEEIIAGRIGMEHMIYSMIRIASAHTDQGIFFNEEVNGIFGIYTGQPDDASAHRKAMVPAIAELFSGSAIPCHLSEDIVGDIWNKYATNMTMNLPQAVIGCGLGAYTDSEHVGWIAAQIAKEVSEVAHAKGIDIGDLNVRKMVSASGPEARYSTLQDLDAKKPTEIDMFAGKLVSMGRELGISTPCTEYTYHVVKALEEKNAGKFDY